MAEFQELAKAINDNSQCLVQTAQGMSEHNRTMIECTKQIVAEVGSLDLGETENKEKSIGFGQLKVFDGNPKLYENWIKDIEKAAFLNHANDRKKQLLAYQFSGTCFRLYKKILRIGGTQGLGPLKGEFGK